MARQVGCYWKLKNSSKFANLLYVRTKLSCSGPTRELNSCSIMNPETSNPADEKPPIFHDWWQLYLIVLLSHALIILLFYLFTHTYS